jgi:hypothetical protein
VGGPLLRGRFALCGRAVIDHGFGGGWGWGRGSGRGAQVDHFRILGLGGLQERGAELGAGVFQSGTLLLKQTRVIRAGELGGLGDAEQHIVEGVDVAVDREGRRGLCGIGQSGVDEVGEGVRDIALHGIDVGGGGLADIAGSLPLGDIDGVKRAAQMGAGDADLLQRIAESETGLRARLRGIGQLLLCSVGQRLRGEQKRGYERSEGKAEGQEEQLRDGFEVFDESILLVENDESLSLSKVGLWRSWERASMAWKRSSVRSRPGPPTNQ